MHAPFAALTALFLSAVTAATAVSKVETTIYSDARDFYHNLTIKKQQELLLKASLQDPAQVEALHRLLSNKTYNIARFYHEICNEFEWDHVNEILELVRDREDSNDGEERKKRKELEMLLLGPACLSETIIMARKTFGMWPLSGFPVLVDSFKPKSMEIGDVRDILEEALKNPEWWQSYVWITYLDWDKMEDLRFWRMFPPSAFSLKGDCTIYMIRSLLQIGDQGSPQDLEELLMKSARILSRRDTSIYDLAQLFDPSALFDKFSHLQDEWSPKVLDYFVHVNVLDWDPSQLANALFDSGLLKVSSWQVSPIDAATATNDILQLFIFAYRATNYEERKKIQQDFVSFLDSPVDWNIIEPQLHDLLWSADQEAGSMLLKKRLDNMRNNPRAFVTLSPEPLEYSTGMEIYKRKIKENSKPLMETFSELKASGYFSHDRHIYSYTELLCHIWIEDEENWPGMVIAHDRIKGHVRRVFRPSSRQNGTVDPRTDQEFDRDAWLFAIESIMFEVEYDIPCSAVPSIDFLRDMMERRGFSRRGEPPSWLGFNRQRRGGYAPPEESNEQTRYMAAVESASLALRRYLPLHRADPEDLQAMFREGDRNRTAEAASDLASGLANITLQ